MSTRPKCLRCGADSSWIEGRVPDEPPSELIPAAGSVPDWLLEKTFVVEYNPNCPQKWLVRMCGKSAVIDKKPYRAVLTHRDDAKAREEELEKLTKDALGFGDTLAEAAEWALAAQVKLKARNMPVGLHG